MADLTKTQETLLRKAAASSRGTVAICYGYRTGQKNGYGSRASQALRSLRDMGLVGPIESSRGREYYGKGECDHYTEAWAAITDAGREAVR